MSNCTRIVATVREAGGGVGPQELSSGIDRDTTGVAR
jgi:hypothetical protein